MQFFVSVFFFVRLFPRPAFFVHPFDRLAFFSLSSFLPIYFNRGSHFFAFQYMSWALGGPLTLLSDEQECRRKNADEKMSDEKMPDEK